MVGLRPDLEDLAVVSLEIVKLSDMVHGDSSENAKGGHDDKPESVAVLGFGDFENASRQGEGDGCAVILEGVDDSCCKARHFLSSNVHRGGGANN